MASKRDVQMAAGVREAIHGGDGAQRSVYDAYMFRAAEIVQKIIKRCKLLLVKYGMLGFLRVITFEMQISEFKTVSGADTSLYRAGLLCFRFRARNTVIVKQGFHVIYYGIFGLYRQFAKNNELMFAFLGIVSIY